MHRGIYYFLLPQLQNNPRAFHLHIYTCKNDWYSTLLGSSRTLGAHHCSEVPTDRHLIRATRTVQKQIQECHEDSETVFTQQTTSLLTSRSIQSLPQYISSAIMTSQIIRPLLSEKSKNRGLQKATSSGGSRRLPLRHVIMRDFGHPEQTCLDASKKPKEVVSTLRR